MNYNSRFKTSGTGIKELMLRMSGTGMKNGIAMKSASSKKDLHCQELGLRKKVRREDLEANFRVSNKIFALFFYYL